MLFDLNANANEIDVIQNLSLYNLSLFKNVWKKNRIHLFKYLLKYSRRNEFTKIIKMIRLFSFIQRIVSHPFIFYINFVRINNRNTKNIWITSINNKWSQNFSSEPPLNNSGQLSRDTNESTTSQTAEFHPKLFLSSVYFSSRTKGIIVSISSLISWIFKYIFSNH